MLGEVDGVSVLEEVAVAVNVPVSVDDNGERVALSVVEEVAVAVKVWLSVNDVLGEVEGLIVVEAVLGDSVWLTVAPDETQHTNAKADTRANKNWRIKKLYVGLFLWSPKRKEIFR